MDMNINWDSIMAAIQDYGMRLVGAVVVLVIGLWIVKAISNGFGKILDKRDVDATLRPFLTGLVGGLLKVMLFISVLGMLGIQMTSFIAILGAVGLAVGMALSGTLQNFAGGVILLILKPYKVGDWIEAQGYAGTVNSIQIFHTVLKTPDNKTIIIPNGGLSTGSVTNYSTEPKRRVDFVFGIGYGDDYDKAKSVLMDIVNGDDRIHQDPAPFIALSELADSSVNLVVRVWVDAPNYWGVKFDTTEKVYKVFDKEGLNIPFPQMDVHVHNS